MGCIINNTIGLLRGASHTHTQHTHTGRTHTAHSVSHTHRSLANSLKVVGADTEVFDTEASCSYSICIMLASVVGSVSRRLVRSGLQGSGGVFVCRSLSSTALVSDVPQNLIVDDPNVLKVPVTKITIDDIRYTFPSMDAPKSINVFKFQNPGEKLEAEVELNPQIFNVALRKDIVLEAIRHQRAALRQPHKTKRIGELRGSNKKPRPQKGTGGAQVGHRRNSAWKGGQKAHGPVLRDFSIGLNRKVRAKALMIALAAKLREGNLIVFDELKCEVGVYFVSFSQTKFSLYSRPIRPNPWLRCWRSMV
jgi:hypothetical protein